MRTVIFTESVRLRGGTVLVPSEIKVKTGSDNEAGAVARGPRYVGERRGDEEWDSGEGDDGGSEHQILARPVGDDGNRAQNPQANASEGVNAVPAGVEVPFAQKS